MRSGELELQCFLEATHRGYLLLDAELFLIDLDLRRLFLDDGMLHGLYRDLQRLNLSFFAFDILLEVGKVRGVSRDLFLQCLKLVHIHLDLVAQLVHIRQCLVVLGLFFFDGLDHRSDAIL